MLRNATCGILLGMALFCPFGLAQEWVGITVTPHESSAEMRWRRPADPELAARVEVFLQNQSDQPVTLTGDMTFDGQTAGHWVEQGEWAWHDTPALWSDGRIQLEPQELTVLAWNGHSAAWGVRTDHRWKTPNAEENRFELAQPHAWISGITFVRNGDPPSNTTSLLPNRAILHVRNEGGQAIKLKETHFWLPVEGTADRRFVRADIVRRQKALPEKGQIKPSDTGLLIVDCDDLPLGYGVIQVSALDAGGESIELWALLRIKTEVFDISGGWVATNLGERNSLTTEPYLKTLSRMHINTGQIQNVAGYTDRPELYEKYPIKRFNRMQPIEAYDQDAILPTIHAVEFLGEPQYGGGRPVPPQEVHDALSPYRSSRLATSVTLSEERTWRYYAGLSDYPHYDAYRVIAPAADSWGAYDRWGGDSIRWGAPLETIGVMTRSLRHHSRPRPIAYWSQGAHHDWGSWRNPRRGSPTPDELRSQAWHGLGNGITSLYWFNLSLESLLKFPDLIEPINRVNREIRMLDSWLLESQLFEYQRIETEAGPQWDLTHLAGPRASIFAIHDLAYRPNLKKREFEFSARQAEVKFRLPPWMTQTVEVFRVDADGVHEVKFRQEGRALWIEDEVRVVGIYGVTQDPGMRSEIQRRHRELVEHEASLKFDPGSRPEDLQALRELMPVD
jgi:hypothetical protein